MDENLFLNPMIQYGFAGFSGVLLVIIVWLIRRLLDVLRENNKVIIGNTSAISEVRKLTEEELKLLRTINDRLLMRPCIAKGEIA